MTIKRCTRCVLPETFPSIRFDSEGVCNYCNSFRGSEHLEKSKAKYRKRFEELLAKRKKKGSYDCLIAYSGGKDSTYTIVVLKKVYNLTILALTVDNGFMSPAARDNIDKVVTGLDVDHIMFKPGFEIMRTIFRAATNTDLYSPKTLERASTICTSCMAFVKFIALRLAIEGYIPFIGYGWSPGQAPIEASIYKNNPSMTMSMQTALLEPMKKIAGDRILHYFLADHHFSAEERFPHNISPLAFLDYDEREIIGIIKDLGWEKPADTDPNSTNCLLNAYANKVHKGRFGFHPYAFELAKLVREGYMDRNEAIQRLETVENPSIIEAVEKRLSEK